MIRKSTGRQLQTQVSQISLKSCTLCNKRKKKCDRLLPNCTSCVKRGVKCSYDSKRRACSACRKVKLLCSRDFPSCQRCIEKGLECNYPSLYSDKRGNPAHNGSSSKKANQCLVELMGRQNEPSLCSQIEENQHQFQPQNNIGAKENKNSVEQFLTVKRKQDHLVPHDFQYFPGHLLLPAQARTGTSIKTMQQEMDLSFSCKTQVPKRSRQFLRQDVGFGIPDASVQKNPDDEFGGQILPFVVKMNFDDYIQMPLSQRIQIPNPVFQTDDYKEHQSIKQYMRSRRCTVENDRASTYSTLSESSSFVGNDCPVNVESDGKVISQPKYPSPNQTRFPPESSIFGTNFGLFIATFIRRYSIAHDFLVDMDGIQKAIYRAFADERGTKSLYEVPTTRPLSLDEMKERARHAGLLAAIGLGRIQLWSLDREEHDRCYNLIRQLLECCTEQVTEELIVAHGVAHQYCKLTNNRTGLQRHFRFFNKTLDSCKSKLEGRARSIHSFFALWKCLRTSDKLVECDRYTWQLIEKEANKFCCFEKDFPLMHNFSLSQAPLNLSTQHQQILLNYLKYVPSQKIGMLSLPTISWVRKILIDAQTSDNFRAQALQEVLTLIGSASKIYHCKGAHFAPSVKCLLLSMQSFLLLLAGKCSKAKAVLEKQVQMYSHDPLLCASLPTPAMIHQTHFLCMALSTLELHDCYHTFQKKVNTMANFLGMPHVPREPPTSNHGLCDDPKCMLLWNRLSIPDLPNFSEDIFNAELWEVDIW